MAIMAVAVCVICAVLAYLVERNFYCPAFLFSMMWAAIAFFTSLRLYGLYEVSDLVYTIVIVGTISFCIGCIIGKQIRNQKFVFGRKNLKGIIECEFINYRAIYIMSAIVMFYMVVQAAAVFVIMRNGANLFDVRSALQGYSDSDFTSQITILRHGNVWLTRFYDWIVLPGFHSLIVVTCIDMVVGQKNKIVLVMTIINAGLKVYSEGSRVVIFDAVIYIVIILLIYGKNFQISARMKKWIKRIIIVGVALLIIVSNIRLETMQKTLAEEVYLYFCCCLPLLDVYAKSFLNNSVFTYGAVTLYGLIQPVVRLLQYTGLPFDWYIAAGDIVTNTETFYIIRNATYSTGANAYTTLYYSFLSDGGMVGCVIGAILFGFTCNRTYTNLQKKMKYGESHYRELFVFLVLVLFIINSFIRIQFSRVDFANMLYFSLVFFRKNKTAICLNKERK